MIDPWKFNPLSILGTEAGKQTSFEYTKSILSKYDKIIEEFKKINKEVEEGKRTIVTDSKNLFL